MAEDLGKELSSEKKQTRHPQAVLSATGMPWRSTSVLCTDTSTRPPPLHFKLSILKFNSTFTVWLIRCHLADLSIWLEVLYHLVTDLFEDIWHSSWTLPVCVYVLSFRNALKFTQQSAGGKKAASQVQSRAVPGQALSGGLGPRRAPALPCESLWVHSSPAFKARAGRIYCPRSRSQLDPNRWRQGAAPDTPPTWMGRRCHLAVAAGRIPAAPPGGTLRLNPELPAPVPRLLPALSWWLRASWHQPDPPPSLCPDARAHDQQLQGTFHSSSKSWPGRMHPSASPQTKLAFPLPPHLTGYT